MVKLANRVRLIQSVVDTLKPKAKDYIVWDAGVRGFGVRVKPNGSRTWVFQFRNAQGDSRRMTLGALGELTPKEARDLAEDYRKVFRKGGDPAADKAAERGAKTVSELCDDYLKWIEKRAQRPLKASTIANDRSRIEAHVKPLLGRKAVKSLDVDAIEQFFQDVADGKSATKPKDAEAARKRGGVIRGGLAAAHRTTEMLGSILQYAVGKKILAVNPVPLFKRKKDKPLPPPFSIEAVQAVGKAMRALEAEGEPAVGVRAIRHLLLTGFRRMEGLTLVWGAVDAAGHCARLADTKTGPQLRPLGQAALDHLASFKPKDAKAKDFVFPGPGKNGHYVGAPKAWARIAERAKIEGVSLHGLRHWFASTGAEMGYSDIVIGAIIGHAKRGITGRYATAPDSALVFAANRISQRIADALDGKAVGKVVQFSAGAAS